MVFGSANINYVLPENIEQHILDGYKLIDVREDDEWNAGHHSGAKHIPMSTIPENLNTFEESEKYCFYLYVFSSSCKEMLPCSDRISGKREAKFRFPCSLPGPFRYAGGWVPWLD